MIEINLVPDVKQELIKAQRVRTSVISMAILVGIASVAVIVILAFWVFAVQTARGVLTDGSIRTESEKLANVEDISKTLTIQNQLSKLAQMHNDKSINSRLFDILTTINPSAPNQVAITNVSLDSGEKTIRLEAQARNGYPALEVFKKTIQATKFAYTLDGEQKSVLLADQISDSDRSYGEDSSGARVLRFTLSFVYPEDLFTRAATDAVISAPEKSNATDSFRGVPSSLFTARAGES